MPENGHILPKTIGVIFSILICAFSVDAQMRVDSTWVLNESDTASYSIYIPSGYQQGQPHAIALGLHPFNPARWNAKSWCDTLQTWAEKDQLILVCPDGGIDGKVDDPRDTAFASVLLDSMQQWYSVDASKLIAVGFSWGGRTAYTYGLSHAKRFSGFICIGAVADTGLLKGMFGPADNKPFYMIHGSQDSPEQRMYPIRDSLIIRGAYVKEMVLKGVGHTIDFSGRNTILSDAYHWIDSVRVMLQDTTNSSTNRGFGLIGSVPEVAAGGRPIKVEYQMSNPGNVKYTITDVSGKVVATKKQLLGKGRQRFSIPTKNIPWGLYNLNFFSPHEKKSFKLMIRG